MTQLTVFLRKEVLGGWRNKKIIICGVIFLMVGMLSPFLAKNNAGYLFPSIVTDGIQITVSTPTSVDSWMQFYGISVHWVSWFL